MAGMDRIALFEVVKTLDRFIDPECDHLAMRSLECHFAVFPVNFLYCDWALSVMKFIHQTFEYIHDDGYGKDKIGQSASLIFYLLILSSYVAVQFEMIRIFFDHSQ